MSNFRKDIIDHSKETREGKLNLGKILHIPSERFSLDPFVFTLTIDIASIDKVTAFSTVFVMAVMLFCGHMWGVQGYISVAIYLCLVIAIAMLFMIHKLKKVDSLSEDLAQSMKDGDVNVTQTNLVANTDKGKNVLTDLATIVSFLYYDSVYSMYKGSAKSSGASFIVMLVFLSALVYITNSYTLAYLVTFYLGGRIIYEVIRLKYITRGIEYVQRFNEKLHELIDSKSNENVLEE